MYLSPYAVLMAAGGIYSAISFSVSRRTRELGLRMALGAERGDVLSPVVRDGILLTVIGMVIGVARAALSSRVLASQLYGIPTTDVLTYGITAVLLFVIAGLASYLPARSWPPSLFSTH